MPFYMLSLWGLAQAAPVYWECEDALARCRSMCNVDYGREGIAGPRLNNCLAKCQTTVQGCRERAKSDAAYAPTGARDWEKPPEQPEKPPEPVHMGEPAPKKLPPRITPREAQEPAAEPVFVGPQAPPPREHQAPAEPAPREYRAPAEPPPTETPPVETSPKEQPLPAQRPAPPPAEDNWKPWTPPPEKKPRERPIDEWDPN